MPVKLHVPLGEGVLEPVLLDEGVPVWLPLELGVAVSVTLRVELGVAECVAEPVRLPELVADCVNGIIPLKYSGSAIPTGSQLRPTRTPQLIPLFGTSCVMLPTRKQGVCPLNLRVVVSIEYPPHIARSQHVVRHASSDETKTVSSRDTK